MSKQNQTKNLLSSCLKKKLKINYIFGVSSKNADGDNCQKAFQDMLAEKYGFNDRQIYKWNGEK